MVNDSDNQTKEEESIVVVNDSDNESNTSTEEEDLSVGEDSKAALTATQLALRKNRNNFVESSFLSESSLSTNSKFDEITAEQKAEVLANNKKFFNSNPSDAVYYRG